VSPEPEAAAGEKATPSQLLEADAFMAFIVFNYAESMARYCTRHQLHQLEFLPLESFILPSGALRTTPPTARSP
jgi:hypothetical protein